MWIFRSSRVAKLSRTVFECMDQSHNFLKCLRLGSNICYIRTFRWIEHVHRSGRVNINIYHQIYLPNSDKNMTAYSSSSKRLRWSVLLVLVGLNWVQATNVRDGRLEKFYVDVFSSDDVQMFQRTSQHDDEFLLRGRRETNQCIYPGEDLDCDTYKDSQCRSCCWTDDNGDLGQNSDGSQYRWCWSRRDSDGKRKQCICGKPPYADKDSCIPDGGSVSSDDAPGYCKSYKCCSQICRCAETGSGLDCRCL